MTAKCQSAARRSEDALFILTDLLTTEGAEDEYRYNRYKMRLYGKYAVQREDKIRTGTA